MTIRSIDRFTAALWDWGLLDACFAGTKIRIGDLDGIVERNGEFLVLEGKGPGVTITQGQHLMFKRMAFAKGFTVIVMFGEPGSPEQLQIWYPGKSVPKIYRGANAQLLCERVSAWFRWANRKNDWHRT